MIQHIHFIWIENSPPLVKKGINLSSKYFINIEAHEEDGRKKGKIFIKNNPNFIPGFFGKSNLVDVTGIIGKNGAGKSSILNYIKAHLPQGLQASVTDDVVIYTEFEKGKDGKEINESGKILYPSSWEIELLDETKLFQNVRYNNNLFEPLDPFNLVSDLNQTFIYYSFMVDNKIEGSDYQGLKNISTSSLLQDEWKEKQEARRTKIDDSKYNEASDLDSFIGNEIAKSIQLIISEHGDKLPFRKPESLDIYINQSDRLFFNEKNKDNNDVFQLIQKLDALSIGASDIEILLNNFYSSILINFLHTQRKYGGSIWYKYDLSIQSKESVKEFVVRFFKDLHTVTHQDDKGKDISVTKHIELSKTVPDFLSFFDDQFQAKTIVPFFDKGSYFKIELHEGSDKLFKQLMIYYLHVKGFTAFLDFRWRNLSTGQQSFLSFMSRFFHVKHHEIGNDQLEKNLVIMIDEGDAGYHPDWQRKYFKNAIDFLCELYSEHNIQLILTANAPFLTSDLPKSNVLFLEAFDDGTVIIHEKENNRAETFGANIHTLFSDSFYMDGAIIGAFAKEKIDTIIKYLSPENSEGPNLDYKRTIDLIGEPILRRKLEEMWNEKFALNEELEMLRNRIEEILSTQSSAKMTNKTKKK